MKHKLEPRLLGEKSITADDTTYGRKRRRTKEPLDERERRVEKVGLKLNIQKLRDTCY